VHVAISLNSLNEDLRRVLEPRSATAARRLETIAKLSDAGIPVTVMIAPVIPGLNNHEIFNVAKAASEAGARNIGHTIVRLNGSIGDVFRDWVVKNFPDRAAKVLHQIESCHGGNINDSQWGRRMTGEGNIAKEISDMMRIARQKYFAGREIPPLNMGAFIRTPKNGQMAMF
jgi:DNA repair photolyase